MSGGYAAKNGALHETAPRGFDEATVRLFCVFC